MTGDTIRDLRKALGFTTAEFAQLLGVNPSTIYRWEATGPMDAKVETLQFQILAQLQAITCMLDDEQKWALGSGMKVSLLLGGTLKALFHLLTQAFKGPPSSGLVPEAKAA